MGEINVAEGVVKGTVAGHIIFVIVCSGILEQNLAQYRIRQHYRMLYNNLAKMR